MKDYIEERVREVGNYILTTKATIRKTAKVFGVSKTTIDKDVTVRLNELNPQIAKQVNDICQHNFAIKHIRGGIATKIKYENSNN